MRFEDDSVESAKVVKQWNVKIISVSISNEVPFHTLITYYSSSIYKLDCTPYSQNPLIPVNTVFWEIWPIYGFF